MKFRSLTSFLCSIVLIVLIQGCQTNNDLVPNEGFIDVTGGKIWYRINGTGNKAPILLLHGGPGSSSYYLEPLKALAHDRPVIFIDQLGSGRSTRITDTTLMTIEKNVEQLEQVRQALNLKDFYLYGHSWGTMLGLDYYLTYPDEVKAIIFHSPLFSTKMWIQDADTLIATLPDSIQTIIRENERDKSYNTEAYKGAVAYFYSKFLRRKDRPQSQKDSSTLMDGLNVYEFMWGPSEFTATGNLLNYDRLKNLPEIKVPTLLLAGEYDEARPITVRSFQSLIPGSQFVVIPEAGHVTMGDNPLETIKALNQFLEQLDNAEQTPN